MLISARASASCLADLRALAPIGARGLILSRIDYLIPNRSNRRRVLNRRRVILILVPAPHTTHDPSGRQWEHAVPTSSRWSRIVTESRNYHGEVTDSRSCYGIVTELSRNHGVVTELSRRDGVVTESRTLAGWLAGCLRGRRFTCKRRIAPIGASNRRRVILFRIDDLIPNRFSYPALHP